MPESLAVHRFPPLIKAYQERYPEVRLQFITCSLEGLDKDLRKGIVDLAFLLAESVNAADLSVKALGVEQLVLAAAPDHPLCRATTVRTADLAGETMLFSRVDCSYRKSIEALFAQTQIHPAHTVEFHSVEALKRCVMAGVGVAPLPWLAVAEEVAAGGLTLLDWTEGALEVAVLMLWYEERWLSPALHRFMALAQETLGGGGRKQRETNL